MAKAVEAGNFDCERSWEYSKPPQPRFLKGTSGEENMEIILVIVAIGSILANALLTALNFKLYTEYWKDSTIKRRYENK